MVHSPWSIVHCHGPWSMVHGPWTMDNPSIHDTPWKLFRIFPKGSNRSGMHPGGRGSGQQPLINSYTPILLEIVGFLKSSPIVGLGWLGSARLGLAQLYLQSGRFAYTRHVVFKNPATEVNCNVWTRMGVPRPGLAWLGAAWPIPAQPGSARTGEGLFTSARVGETRSFAGPHIYNRERRLRK